MGLFSSKKIEPKMTDLRSPQQQAVDSFLSNFITSYGGQYKPGQPYTDPRVAGMSGYEAQGMDSLQGYLNQPNTTPNLTAAQDYLTQAITGGFDPKTSPYYAPLREEAERNRQMAIKASNADYGGRDKYFSTDAMAKTGDINAATAIGLNKNFADLATQERNRQDAAVKFAPNFENFMMNLPLQKTAAAQQYGALPRTIQQADYEAQYQDFLRKQQEGQGVVSTASGFKTQPMTQSYDAYKPSAFESFVMPLLTQAIPAMMTGGASLPFTMGASTLASTGGQGGAGLIGAMGNQGGFWPNAMGGF